MVEPCLGRADLFETRHWPELACGTTLLDQGSNDNELGQFWFADFLALSAAARTQSRRIDQHGIGESGHHLNRI